MAATSTKGDSKVLISYKPNKIKAFNIYHWEGFNRAISTSLPKRNNYKKESKTIISIL